MFNVFLFIAIADILMIAILNGLGYWAVEKEMKDTWKGEKTMEIRKSRRLAKEWREKHPILNWLQSYYYCTKRVFEYPGDWYRECKWFIQRGKRGYSDRDLWGFHNYLQRVIKEGCIYLKENKHGVPCEVDDGTIPTSKDGNWTDAGFEKARKKWDKILDKIIWSFEALEKVEYRDWILVPEEKDRPRLRKFVKSLNNPDEEPLFEDLPPREPTHLMTKTEMKKYNEGWDLFKKYFQNLWD